MKIQDLLMECLLAMVICFIVLSIAGCGSSPLADNGVPTSAVGVGPLDPSLWNGPNRNPFPGTDKLRLPTTYEVCVPLRASGRIGTSTESYISSETITLKGADGQVTYINFWIDKKYNQGRIVIQNKSGTQYYKLIKTVKGFNGVIIYYFEGGIMIYVYPDGRFEIYY